MKLLDSRRLTGPNLICHQAGAIIDVTFEDVEAIVIEHWQLHASNLLKTLNWLSEKTYIRRYEKGASLVITAPIDALYTATEMNEWCWDSAIESSRDNNKVNYTACAESFKKLLDEECNPTVIEIQNAASERNIPFLRDDEMISLGYGGKSQTWPVESLPQLSALDWGSLAPIPLVLITGTNGKTTSTRLTAHILKSSGLNVGISSTDGIAINGKIVESGDFSGPSGARTVLRNKNVDIAILETARGGMLRRGLGVTRANASLITNVAADHMGDFGVQTLEQLADVKWIVSSVLTKNDKLILNAEDPLLLQRAENADMDIVWFSKQHSNAMVAKSIEKRKSCCTVEDGMFIYYNDGIRNEVVSVNSVPVTMKGAAVYNMMNVLGVIALCKSLGINNDAIGGGLVSFATNQNPGRGNYFNFRNLNVIVDFAHNPHGVSALLQTAKSFPANRRLLIIGQAGDRSDEDITQLAIASVKELSFDKILIKKMSRYNRGRATGETANLLKQTYLAEGVSNDVIEMLDTELSAVEFAFDWAQPGDLLVFLIHEDMPGILSKLENMDRQFA